MQRMVVSFWCCSFFLKSIGSEQAFFLSRWTAIKMVGVMWCQRPLYELLHTGPQGNRKSYLSETLSVSLSILSASLLTFFLIVYFLQFFLPCVCWSPLTCFVFFFIFSSWLTCAAAPITYSMAMQFNSHWHWLVTLPHSKGRTLLINMFPSDFSLNSWSKAVVH